MTVWQLRYKTPRSMEDRKIETFTEDEAEARELADLFLASLMSPNVRFVRLVRDVMDSSSQHPELVEKWADKAPEPTRGKTKRAEPAAV